MSAEPVRLSNLLRHLEAVAEHRAAVAIATAQHAADAHAALDANRRAQVSRGVAGESITR